MTAVAHDVGADRLTRRTSAPLFAVTGPDGSLRTRRSRNRPARRTPS
ncbi:hypothetical protein ACSNOK_18585 [Streptomyces sp. URMC 126]